MSYHLHKRRSAGHREIRGAEDDGEVVAPVENPFPSTSPHPPRPRPQGRKEPVDVDNPDDEQDSASEHHSDSAQEESFEQSPRRAEVHSPRPSQISGASRPRDSLRREKEQKRHNKLPFDEKTPASRVHPAFFLLALVASIMIALSVYSTLS